MTIATPPIVRADDAARPGPEPTAPARRTVRKLARPVTVEIEALAAMSLVLNANPYGPRYSGDPGIAPGARLGLVLPHHLYVATAGFWFPTKSENWSIVGTHTEREYTGQYQLELVGGYDAVRRRFHVRPLLGVGYLRDRYVLTQSDVNVTSRMQTDTRAVMVIPAVSVLVDVHPHVFLGFVLRVPIAFRVGSGDRLESLGDHDVMLSFTFSLGVSF